MPVKTFSGPEPRRRVVHTQGIRMSLESLTVDLCNQLQPSCVDSLWGHDWAIFIGQSQEVTLVYSLRNLKTGPKANFIRAHLDFPSWYFLLHVEFHLWLLLLQSTKWNQVWAFPTFNDHGRDSGALQELTLGELLCISRSWDNISGFFFLTFIFVPGELIPSNARIWYGQVANW